ncbi:ubiquitin carboxyl-terminal hydrolase 7-like isoform X40 [Oncorhynchus keta]|uniref:ubiquitin carboxyl-terminal hydrolase 7-like isoform X39 n=1 Tax=Oncorhynchus keta TaxID=8018 RepID=UPI00227D2E3D|nr:ubiquitin carboxyl-terminal hydrolase 7-like isoform X39 [Oncorhynchus keta]XP_052315740.1 ubiquitin carboxyl-terminal hydrolase 7-like isoform X40 [Oncorhynchus keta]
MDHFCNFKVSDQEEKQVNIVEKFNRKLNIISDVCEHHGLYNQGATCYLNSVLQVLFMTNDFKEAIDSQVFEQEQQQEPESENKTGVGPQLKKLFEILKTSNAGTEDISSKLGIGNVFEQQDAAQYLEKILSLVNADVSKIFKGQLRHIATCLSPPGHPISDKSRPFWSLPLSMKDSSGFNKTFSVDDCWTEFFRSSTVSGDNKMYCDWCDEKADATIEFQMKDYPEILTLLLKRFQFDYNRMDYVKIDCLVKVPYTLQTARYTYELYAIVDHVGSLRGGHYTSRIKSHKDQKWYVFDDTYVRLLNQQPFMQGFETSRSAYLLMYKKLHAPDLQMNHGTSQDCSLTDPQCQSLLASGEGDVVEKRKEDIARNKGGDHSFVDIEEKREQGCVTETGEDNVEKREQVSVTETGEDNVEKREQGCVTETGEDNVEKREQVSVTETGEDNAGKREQGCVTETGEDNVEKREQVGVTETGEDNAGKREQGCVTETGEDNVEKREQVSVTETGEDNVEKREQGGVTETGEDNVEKREQGCVTETGEDNVEKREQGCVTETKREQSDMKETGEDNIKNGGVEREGERDVVQASREDPNEPSQSTRSPCSVNTNESRQIDLTLKRKGEDKQEGGDEIKEEKIGREQKEHPGEVKKKKKDSRRGRFNRSPFFV